nr:unnamed protein product [Spirometra erinaceieuropaei]
MFANDIKIWSTIRSEVDEARLQTYLDQLEQWSKDWLQPFNVNKCNFLRVGRTSSPNHTVYSLTDKPLQVVDAQKDLGAWITTSLKPSLQCSKVADSAMSILYHVKRRSPPLMETASPSFLIGRSQAAQFSVQQPAEVAVRSGVPQGSVLGPTLFLVCVNDCANERNCDVAMFADDIKIWSTIRSEVDEARLQTNLDHLEQWSKDWLLPFNVNKCNFLRVGRTSSPNHTVYRLTDKALQEVDTQKDLGVWITTSLKPWLQCSNVAKSTMSILYLVKRAFSSFDEDCFAKHGFRKNRSCVTNLLYCLEHWTRAVVRGDMVHVIYIDFKKAFDIVPYHRLLYKRGRSGVRAVYVSDQQSAEVAVRSGVPQGTVLGPTRFLVYVNDCANERNCDVAMFADDMKIWSTIRSEVDEARLQTTLDHLEQWSKDWLLPFNVNKSNFLRVGRTSSPNHTVYRLTDKALQVVDAQKDLGVWITTSLKPSLQCPNVAKSAMFILYLVKRPLSSFDEDCFAKVIQTFVRPHLEFAIQAWGHWTAKDFGIIEKVQRRATKLVSG